MTNSQNSIQTLSSFEEVTVRNKVNFPGRWGHSATLYDHKIYIFGGFNDTLEEGYISSLIYLDLPTMKFVSINQEQPENELPSSRSNHIAVIYHSPDAGVDCLIIYGGTDFNSTLNDMYIYYFEANQWELYDDSSPEIGAYCSGDIIENYLVIVGGEEDETNIENMNDHNRTKNNLFVFDLRVKMWYEVYLEKLEPRSFHCSCFMGQTLIIFGGIFHSYEYCYSDLVEIDLSKAFNNGIFNDPKNYIIRNTPYDSQLNDSEEVLAKEINTIINLNNDEVKLRKEELKESAYNENELKETDNSKYKVDEVSHNNDNYDNMRKSFKYTSEDLDSKLQRIQSFAQDKENNKDKRFININNSKNSFFFNKYDSSNKTTEAGFISYPLPRWAASMVKVNNNSLLLFSGRDPYLKTNLNDLWLLTKANNSDRDVPLDNLLSVFPFDFPTSNDRSFLLNQENHRVDNNNIKWFRIEFPSFKKENIAERRKPALVIYNNNLIVLGGYVNKEFTNEVHILNLSFLETPYSLDIISKSFKQYAINNSYNQAGFFILSEFREKVNHYISSSHCQIRKQNNNDETPYDHDPFFSMIKQYIRESILDLHQRNSFFQFLNKDSSIEAYEKNLHSLVDCFDLIILNRNTAFVTTKINFFKRLSIEDISRSYLKECYNSTYLDYSDFTNFGVDNEVVKFLLILLSEGEMPIHISVCSFYRLCSLLEKLNFREKVKQLIEVLIFNIKALNKKYNTRIKNLDLNEFLWKGTLNQSSESFGYSESKLLMGSLKEYCIHNSKYIINKELFYINTNREVCSVLSMKPLYLLDQGSYSKYILYNEHFSKEIVHFEKPIHFLFGNSHSNNDKYLECDLILDINILIQGYLKNGHISLQCLPQFFSKEELLITICLVYKYGEFLQLNEMNTILLKDITMFYNSLIDKVALLLKQQGHLSFDMRNLSNSFNNNSEIAFCFFNIFTVLKCLGNSLYNNLGEVLLEKIVFKEMESEGFIESFMTYLYFIFAEEHCYGLGVYQCIYKETVPISDLSLSLFNLLSLDLQTKTFNARLFLITEIIDSMSMYINEKVKYFTCFQKKNLSKLYNYSNQVNKVRNIDDDINKIKTYFLSGEKYYASNKKDTNPYLINYFDEFNEKQVLRNKNTTYSSRSNYGEFNHNQSLTPKKSNNIKFEFLGNKKGNLNVEYDLSINAHQEKGNVMQSKNTSIRYFTENMISLGNQVEKGILSSNSNSVLNSFPETSTKNCQSYNFKSNLLFNKNSLVNGEYCSHSKSLGRDVNFIKEKDEFSSFLSIEKEISQKLRLIRKEIINIMYPNN